MKVNNLLILLLVTFLNNACTKKESANKEPEDQLPKLVTIDFDKIDAEKANKVTNSKKKE